MTSSSCIACGAPADARYAFCPFCRAPRSAEAARMAITCPHCRTLVAGDQQQCPACTAWVVVRCLFCEARSPHHAATCGTCSEPFAGMPARFASEERRLANMPAFAREALRQARQMSATARRMNAPRIGMAGMPDLEGLFRTKLPALDANEVIEEEVVEERTENGVRKTIRRVVRPKA